MDWNQAQPSQPVGPQNMQGPSMMPGQGQAPVPQPPQQFAPSGYVGGNPLQPQSPASGMQQAPPAYAPGVPAVAPAMQPPLQAPYSGGQYVQQPTRPAGTTVNLDDGDQVSVDDAVWINRTKRALADSKGDPHRQVQLIQHLRTQYLKQRFGRSVHTDET